jgi:hypothetical protein
MLRLSNIIHGEGKGHEPKAQDSAGPYLDDDARRELGRIVEFFAQDINPKYAIASVVSAKPVEAGGRPIMERNETPLRKGVVTRKPEDMEINVLSVLEARKRSTIIVQCIELFFQCELYQELFAKEDGPERILDFGDTLKKFGFSGYIESRNEGFRRAAKAGIDIKRYHSVFVKADDAIERFFVLLKDGTFERKLGLERGSLTMLFDQLARYESLRPKDVVYMDDICLVYRTSERMGIEDLRLTKELETATEDSARKGHGGVLMTTPHVIDYLKKLRFFQPDQAMALVAGGLRPEDITSIAQCRPGTYMHGIDLALDRMTRKIEELTGIYVMPKHFYWIRSAERERILEELGLDKVARAIELAARASMKEI